MKKSQLVIKSKHKDGWEYVFRKQKGRPIEMLQRHNTLGTLRDWQVAKNFCLKGLVSEDVLADHFGLTTFQYRHNTKNQPEDS